MLLIKKAVIWQDKLGLYNYRKWIKENEPETGRQSSNIINFPILPIFSYLVLWDGDSISMLDDTIRSLQLQFYDNWHATVLVGSKKHAHGLPESPAYEKRIKFTFFNPEQTPIQAIMAAIQQGSEDYVQVFTAGDRLAENANEEIVKAMNEFQKPPDIIYFDEDYLDPKSGDRSLPFFKPDWSPELMLSTNYILNAIFRSELLKITLEQESLSDLDHLVRYSLKYADHIHHIAKVLYHFGTEKKSKPKKRGTPKCTLPVGENNASIIIPTRDHERLLRKCLRSIFENTANPRYEIILVDNASSDEGTRRYYDELNLIPKIRIINYPEEFNFSRALNLGAQASQADVYIFLNNDVEAIQSDWLDELVGWAIQPEIGIVGAKLLYPDGSIQHAGIVVGLEGHAHHVFAGMPEGYSGLFGSVEWYRNYSAITGACMAMRREVFEEIGGFDENFQLAFGDVDMCLRTIRASYRVVYSPHARLIHHEGATRGKYIPVEDIRLGFERFRDIVESGDPYYNPNLSYTFRVPTLKRKFEEPPIKRLKQVVARYSAADNFGEN